MNYLLQTIATNRLKIRKLKPSDLQDIFEYSSNDDAVSLLSWGPHKSLQESKNYLDGVLENYKKESPSNIVWGIELLESNKLIGVVRAFNYSEVSSKIELSYILNPVFQGKGFMKEALNAIINLLFGSGDINRIQAHCSVDNDSSFNLLLSLKFKKEGHLRFFWKIKGVFKDTYILSKIKTLDS